MTTESTEQDQPPLRRFTDGGTFIFDVPDQIPAVWGSGSEVLWAEGEALMIVGPSGVGKTTLTGQLVRGMLGLESEVLGHLVDPRDGNILYLAMDRPQQVRRSMRRSFHPDERPTVEERLIIWEGPPPGDLAKNPHILKDMCERAGASVVILDSLKDAAIGLSDDAVGSGYNSARQHALTAGVQVLELHHQVKRGANGGKPNTLADVYGSTWITSGAGSVAMLWGEAGDSIVEFIHLKQPADCVGPYKIVHDHDNGTSSILEAADPVALLRTRNGRGITARDLADATYDDEHTLSRNDIEKARRRLNRLEKAGVLIAKETPDPNGGNPARVFYLPLRGGYTDPSTHLFSVDPSTGT